MFDLRVYLKMIVSTHINNRCLKGIIEEIGKQYSNEFVNNNSHIHNGRKKLIEELKKQNVKVSVRQIKKLCNTDLGNLNYDIIIMRIPFKTDVILNAIINLLSNDSNLNNYIKRFLMESDKLSKDILYREVLIGEYYNQLIALRTSGELEDDKRALRLCKTLESQTRTLR